MFQRGRHDRHRKAHDLAAYRLRKGMAKVALREKVEGIVARDTSGRPLRSHEMAERHGTQQIARWAWGATTLAVGMAVNQDHPHAARWP